MTYAPGSTRKSQVFTASGNFTVPANVRLVDALVVGGGGAGMTVGWATSSQAMVGGGGGGGQVVTFTNIPVTPGATIAVVIAAGGVAAAVPGAGTPAFGTDGGISSFGVFQAGGGKKANTNSNTLSAQAYPTGMVQGSSGGLYTTINSGQSGGGGGGGGAGGNAGAGAGTNPLQIGPTLTYSTATAPILVPGTAMGSSAQINSPGVSGGKGIGGYGGGGGGSFSLSGAGTNYGLGTVSDGGGAGGISTDNNNGNAGTNGTANTGGGGGGGAGAPIGTVAAQAKGGDGGSGIVIVYWWE